MKNIFKKALVSLMVFALVITPIPPCGVSAAEKTTNVLDAGNLDTFASGAKKDGDKTVSGIFTIYWGAKSKVDESVKSFSDGVKTAKRINFQGKSEWAGTDEDGNATLDRKFIEVKATGTISLKIYWVSGGTDRPLQILDANKNVIKEFESGAANALTISEATFDCKTDKFYIFCPNNGNPITRVEVSTEAASNGGSTPVIPATGDKNLGIFAVTGAALAACALLVFKKRK